MSPLVPCQGCGRHHRSAELACPHCGLAVADYGARAMVRNLKVGALLAFTAAATAACYGTPNYVPPPGDPGAPTANPVHTTAPKASPDAGATN